MKMHDFGNNYIKEHQAISLKCLVHNSTSIQSFCMCSRAAHSVGPERSIVRVGVYCQHTLVPVRKFCIWSDTVQTDL